MDSVQLTKNHTMGEKKNIRQKHQTFNINFYYHTIRNNKRDEVIFKSEFGNFKKKKKSKSSVF